MRRLVAGVFLTVMIAAVGVSLGDDEGAPRFRCRFLAPTEGGPVDHYEVEIRDLYNDRIDTLTAGHDADQAEQIFEFEGLPTDWETSAYIVRVRAVNAAGAGPWTDYSNTVEPAFQDDPPG
jgi:hypothetical protein